MNGPAPLLTLNNGVRMPALGLGVYQSPPDETVPAVTTAIGCGYRLIDTAAAYGNEKEVGEGIARSGIAREDIFVITKLWLTDYGYDSTLRAFDTSLTKLGLDHLDLYLLHWPVPSTYDATVASYKAAEKLLADGRVRAIGVCNHTPQHLTDLMARTEVVPAVNQVELHPNFSQPELRAFDVRHGIRTQSWSPIGGVNRYGGEGTDKVRDPLQEPTITGLAEKYGRSPAQIILRWQVEHELCAIPKSVKPHRIAENIGIFDFSLTPHEVAAIDALDTGARGGPDPDRVALDTFS
ncbi:MULTISPECIES: aldo/keto reductase [Streptomyces violaceusniger group]|uniref:Aldo/keto reductase n=2 Tax=Streptomyces javensis TaxID=114698 RepID=A0ABP4HSV3_9ACTN|nr:aldo/keto reductase [Streptomyces javensis]MBI0312497.1 aldo/keto reductase [Streptomyces javensis]